MASLHGAVDMIDQLLLVDSIGVFEQIAATTDDRHDIRQIVTEL
jgi:hypothetical protein